MTPSLRPNSVLNHELSETKFITEKSTKDIFFFKNVKTFFFFSLFITDYNVDSIPMFDTLAYQNRHRKRTRSLFPTFPKGKLLLNKKYHRIIRWIGKYVKSKKVLAGQAPFISKYKPQPLCHRTALKEGNKKSKRRKVACRRTTDR
jgi:hypothetical protein